MSDPGKKSKLACNEKLKKRLGGIVSHYNLQHLKYWMPCTYQWKTKLRNENLNALHWRSGGKHEESEPFEGLNARMYLYNEVEEEESERLDG